jgi:chromosome segregation ATPase
MNGNDSFADRVRVYTENAIMPGLVFSINSTVLREKILERVEFHVRRAAEKEAELPALEATVKSLEESIDKIKGFTQQGAAKVVATFSNKSATNYGFDGSSQVSELEQQINALRQDIKDHRNKATSFTLLADSLFGGTYALEWADLQRVELVK